MSVNNELSRLAMTGLKAPTSTLKYLSLDTNNFTNQGKEARRQGGKITI